MLRSLLTVSVTLSVLLADTSLTAAGPIVTTQHGQLEGSRKIHNGMVYEEYLSIPFAAPPVGDLRWQKPQPVTPWEGILNATVFSQHCVQAISRLYPFVGFGEEDGEDCLYLNVWVPRGVLANQGRKLPVMFFIYGGGFQIGTAEMYPVNGLALGGDVIGVNINYRVNAMGFFSTEDENAPGNYGLWDQYAALKWVTENIDVFAGDASRITIFGQSAGATSVSHLVISPHTNTLFHNAIAISGASASSWGVARPGNGLATAIRLGEALNCSASTTAQIVECLHKETAEDLNFWGKVVAASFSPMIDGDFITQWPKMSFQQGAGNHIHFITGNTYHDSAGFIIGNPIALPFLEDRINVAETNESMWNYFLASYSYANNTDELIAAVMNRYPELDTTDNLTRTIELTFEETHEGFGSGGNWEATTRARGNGLGRTYQYVFQHRQSFLVGYPEWINGSHMDDIYSVLGEPFFDTYRRIYLRADFDETDLRVSDHIMKYYSNFAYSGDPNQGPNEVPVEWTEFDPVLQNYLHQAPYFSMQEYDQDTLDKYWFWTDEFPPMIEYPLPPTMPPNEDNYSLTEEDIQLGIRRFREELLHQFGDIDGIQQQVDDYIDSFVQRRNIRFNL